MIMNTKFGTKLLNFLETLSDIGMAYSDTVAMCVCENYRINPIKIYKMSRH